jgi:hypothetical protein
MGRIFITLMLAAAVLTGCATAPTSADNAPHGSLRVATAVPPSGMYRLVLQRVDNKPVLGGGARRVPPTVSLMVVSQYYDIADSRSDFDLPAGEHTLSFTAVVDRQDARLFAPAPRSGADAGAGELKLNVEAGQRYFIAAQINDAQPERWQAVIYKTEPLR